MENSRFFGPLSYLIGYQRFFLTPIGATPISLSPDQTTQCTTIHTNLREKVVIDKVVIQCKMDS